MSDVVEKQPLTEDYLKKMGCLLARSQLPWCRTVISAG